MRFNNLSRLVLISSMLIGSVNGGELEDYFDDIDADLHRLSSEQGDFAKKVCIHLLSIFSIYFRILH